MLPECDDMNNAKRMNQTGMRNAAVWLTALAAAAVFLTMPQSTARGAEEGLRLCLNVAVPSLFPMMFASVLTVETGFAQAAGKRLSPITRRCFALTGESGAALLIAITGGFPAGAKAVSSMYSRGEISREDAERMLLFCFSAGPAFLVGTVGRLYSDSSVGWLLLIIQIASVFILGFLSRLLPRGSAGSAAEKAAHPKSLASAMTFAAAQTSSAMMNICIFIVLFSTLRAILDDSGAAELLAETFTYAGMKKSAAQALLPVLLEVTSGCVSASRAGLPLTAFAVGFGGLAVHMQIMSIADNVGLKYAKFFAARLIQGVICAALAQLSLLILPGKAVPAMAPSGAETALGATPVGAVTLIVMSAMCVLCLSGLSEKKRKR